MSDKHAGEDKFEQAKGGGKADDLNGLGGDLLSKPKATEKAADKVDATKDQAQQAKDGGDKVAPVAQATDLTSAEKEAAMTKSVMERLDKGSIDTKVDALSKEDAKATLEHPNGNVAEQMSKHFHHLPKHLHQKLHALAAATQEKD